MQVKMISKYLVAILILAFSGTSHANDSCQSVKREMVFGQTALKHANDKQGFLKAASEFKKATQKAPNCAAAYYNMGVVYEKAGEYKLAMEALDHYLELSPGAEDFNEVEMKTYELEYLATNTDDLENSKAGWEKYSGTWCDSSFCDDPRWGTADRSYQVAFNGNQFEITQEYFSGQQMGLSKNTKTYSGVVNTDGTFSGSMTDAQLYPNQPNCKNKPLQDSYQVTGEFTQNQIFDTQGNSINGGAIIIRAREWNAHNLDYDNCLKVRSREYGGGWSDTTLILRRR